MEPRNRKLIAYEEPDDNVIRLLDERAKQEGTNRSALIRRAVRQLLFSMSIVPIYGDDPFVETEPFKEVA